MRKKYADYPNWKEVEEKKYINKYFNNKEFQGNISLLTVVKVNEKITKIKDGKKVVVIDDNFKKLEIYPENNKNIAVCVSLNNKDEIINWFFDIAANSSLSESGVPYIDDLYLDIILYPSGEIKIEDEDELKEALYKKDITKEQFDLAYKVADDLIKKIDGKIPELTRFTNKYYGLLK